MKLAISGAEAIEHEVEAVWRALNDPAVLSRCIPGCEQITPTGEHEYALKLQLKVAAASGSFDGTIRLADQAPPTRCVLTLEGDGSLGNATGRAEFIIAADTATQSTLNYQGEAEIGGLVVGVGQRILKSVSKHLIKQFFKDLRGALDA